jgi:hypothetical protein
MSCGGTTHLHLMKTYVNIPTSGNIVILFRLENVDTIQKEYKANWRNQHGSGWDRNS